MQVEAEPPSSPESLEREENRGCALSTRPAGPHTANRRNHRADPQAKGKSRSTQSKRRGLETGASNTQKRFEISSGFAFSHCSVSPSPPAVAGPSREDHLAPCGQRDLPAAHQLAPDGEERCSRTLAHLHFQIRLGNWRPQPRG